MPEQVITKRCCTCKQIKPLSEFYKNRGTKDGLQGACKACDKAYHKWYHQTEKGKAKNRRYYQSKKGKAKNRRYCRSEKGKATNRRYCRSEKGKAHRRRYYKKHPERQKARNAVNQAISYSKFPKAKNFKCSCGQQAEQYHHHKGYKPEHWFDVIPVCMKCHNELSSYHRYLPLSQFP